MTKQEELKTSEEWQSLCKIKVLDPDGWDRRNYRFSWHEEKITRQEFENRLIKSTCEFGCDLEDMWDESAEVSTLSVVSPFGEQEEE